MASSCLPSTIFDETSIYRGRDGGSFTEAEIRRVLEIVAHVEYDTKLTIGYPPSSAVSLGPLHRHQDPGTRMRYLPI